MTVRVLIAAGGTGGHFYPGLAVLEGMRDLTDVTPMFVGTPRGIEARAVPQLGERIKLLDVSPLNGVRGLALARALGKLPVAAAECARTIREFEPDVVLSVGGYASGPITALAVAMRVPTAVIEPNAIPGLTNRLLGHFVTRAFVTWPETEKYFGAGATRVFGSPVRRAFLDRIAAARGVRADKPHVLLVGGSQGAQAINRVMPGAVEHARGRGLDFTVTHQTGTAQIDAVRAGYAARGLDADAVVFIDDIAAAMDRADLVVCRAGASTVAELCVVGRPAIYVPLPTAADDHQRKNAEAVASRGAGFCLEQRNLSVESLGSLLAQMLADPARLRAMGERARAIGMPDSAQRVAAEVLAIARARSS